MLHPDSDQLELGLGEGFLVGASSLPWGGRSPRALTRAHGMFILKAQAGKSVSVFVDPEQCDLWLPMEKGPVYDGASLLLEPKGA